MIEWLRSYCLSLPHTTEHIPWGGDLVFKIGGKMYATTALGPLRRPGPLSPARLGPSFKCTPEDFAELTERPGIVPAPYSARMHWIALETEDALSRAEIKRLVKLSYDLVVAKLPKKTQAGLCHRFVSPEPIDTKLKSGKRLKSKQR